MDVNATEGVLRPPLYEALLLEELLKNERREKPIVVMQQPINFGTDSTVVICQNCQTLMGTTVESSPSTKTHVVALGLFCCLMEQDAPPSYETSITVPYTLLPESIVPTVVVVPQSMNYGPESLLAVCPHCHGRAYTRVESHASTRTHLTALFLFCCLFWPCVCVPYCCDNCQNRIHYCSKCGAYLGVYEN